MRLKKKITSVCLLFITTFVCLAGAVCYRPIEVNAVGSDGSYSYLAIGNSITKHPITPFWWGNWGMAATNYDKDFVHVITSYIEQNVGKVSMDTLYYTSWENASSGDHRASTLSQLDGYLSTDLDLVTIQLGENVMDTTYMQSDFETLISYVKTKAPNAKIIVIGQFWQNDVIDAAKRAACSTQGVPFVDLSPIWGMEYRIGMDAVVWGADGLTHTITDMAVAMHPNDAAMAYIGNAVNSLLSFDVYAPVFDANYYANRYQDIRDAYGYNQAALLKHFLQNGVYEGRQASENFNVLSYRARYADLREYFGNDLMRYVQHYINCGRAEGRNGTYDENLVVDVPATTIEEGPAGTMYRMYNPNSGEHFYTASVVEAQTLKSAGWNYEGYAWQAPTSSNTPVYRVYNSNSGEHHYTTSTVERDNLLSLGWSDEGIGWYSNDNETTPMYRLYNPNATGDKEAGAHHYTQSKEEVDFLISQGWNAEGIGWYGL